MPDSETESKHFFRIFGTFSKKVFRLQLFVSIVGLAEAVPAGSNGQLDLATPERRMTPGGGGRSRLRHAPVTWAGDASGASLFNGREATGRDVGGGRSMAPPFAVWVQWIKYPDRFLRFIPERTGFALGFSRA